MEIYVMIIVGKKNVCFQEKRLHVPCEMFGNTRKVGVYEFFDDEGDLALEDGVEELDDENQAHAQNDECDDEDDDSSRRVAHVPLREQGLT